MVAVFHDPRRSNTQERKQVQQGQHTKRCEQCHRNNALATPTPAALYTTLRRLVVLISDYIVYFNYENSY